MTQRLYDSTILLMLLYVILDGKWLKRRKIEEVARRLASSGVSMIQLREHKKAREIIEDARKIKSVIQNYNIPLLVNNRPDIALEADAGGVHIGQDDVSIYTARKILGKSKLIGVSVHSLEEALLAEKEGANYLSFGSIFPSKTKESVVRSTSILRNIKKTVGIPVFAIGGITLENIDLVTKEDIDGICVSRDILDREDIEKRVREYLKMLTHILRD